MLYIYKNITPNFENGTHYIYENFSDYLTKLGTPFLTISKNSYQINQNQAIITTTDNNANFIDISYLIDYDGNYFKCYYVNDINLQSGYLMLDLSIDYWGTYISKAKIDDIIVNRCNRNITTATGVFDTISYTKNNVATRIDAPLSMQIDNNFKTKIAISDLWAVFILSYKEQGTAFGSINSTKIYTFNIDTIYNKVTNNGQSPIDETTLNANPLYVAQEILTGIYGTRGKVQGSNNFINIDCEILNAYILTGDMLASTSKGIFINVKSLYGEFNGEHAIPVNEVAFETFERNFEINMLYNYNYYFGTRFKGVKLNKMTNNNIVTLSTTIYSNGVKVIVKQGENQVDITDDFEISLTTNSGDLSELASIRYILKTSSQIIGIRQSDEKNLNRNVIDFTSNQLDLINNNYSMSQIGKGSAINLYFNGYINGYTPPSNLYYALYPLFTIACESTTDEQKIIELKGANYKVNLSNITDIFNYNFITNTQNQKTFFQIHLLCP